jgi:hypothetical protein
VRRLDAVARHDRKSFGSTFLGGHGLSGFGASRDQRAFPQKHSQGTRIDAMYMYRSQSYDRELQRKLCL